MKPLPTDNRLSTARASSPPGLAAARTAAVAAAFLLVVLGARWWVVGDFGDGMPYWDQWGGESRVLAAWVEGSFGFGGLVEAHNEHRIAWSRLLWIAVFEGNGRQWDNLPTLYAMAVVGALAAGVFVLGYLGLSGWRAAAPVLLAGLVVFALPLGWLNTVWGFQVQFHAQLLLAGLALLGMASSGGCRDWRWWGGVAAGVAGLFASGGGLLAGAAIALGVLWRCAAERRWAPGWRGTTAAGAGIFFGGLALALAAPGTENRFRAEGVGDCAAALLRNLSWPWHGEVWPCALLWLPLAALLLAGLLGAWRDAERGDVFLVMAGGCVFAQMLAIAWTRGVGGMGPHDRYFDLHALGLFLNFLAVLRLAGVVRLGGTVLRRVGAAMSAAWTCAAVAGVLLLAGDHLAERLPGWKSHALAQAENLRAHLASGLAPATLDGHQRLGLPVESPAIMAREFSFAHERGLLPRVIAQPMRPGIAEAEGVMVSAEPEFPGGIEPEEGAPVLFSSFAPQGGQGRLVTEEIVFRHGAAHFRLAGLPVTGKLSLELDTASGSRQRLEVNDTAGDEKARGWRDAFARVPRNLPVRLAAEDRRDGGWFAVAALRDAGPLSAMALSHRGTGRALCLWSLAALLAMMTAWPTPGQDKEGGQP